MGRRYALFWWTASASLLALLSFSQAQYAALSCVAGSDKEDLVQQCTGSGTLALGGQDTFTLDIYALDGHNEFEGFEVDIDVRLTSVTGNVDLVVTSPSGVSVASHRNVGNDIVYLNRHEIESGEYQLIVSGIAATSNYVVTVYITPERLLNPMEQLVLGQVMLDCCNTVPGSCPALKQKYPTLADNDNSTNPNFCYIHGNVCSRDGRIQEFSMPSNSMACKFPASAFRSLPKLERIDLSNNLLSGNISEIADTLSSAPALQFVDLSNNRLAGRLDQSCGLAKSGALQQLSLKNNSLTGYLPQCLVGVKNLWELHVDNNALVGPLPSIPNAKSSRLVHLTGANQTTKGGGFNGSLPVSIADLSRLAYLDFSGNKLIGDLPRLPATIRRVNLGRNLLTNAGQSTALPPAYGSLPILSLLNLQSNQLSGDIPAEITKIASLKYFDVSSNVITSALPAQWAGLQSLNLLKVDNNQLTGTVPGSLASLPNLNLLDLSNNQFSGTLDDYSASMANSQAGTTYRYFNISNNAIIGPLNDVKSLGNLGLFSPQALSVSSSTTAGSDAPLTLDLGGNAFSGVWPAWLFYALVKAPAPIFVNLQGSTLMCPPAAWQVEGPYNQSRLAGQSCQRVADDGSTQQIPLNQVAVQTEVKGGLSGGAIFGIFLAIVVSLGALAYIGWYFYQQQQRQKAIRAASFGGNVGGFGSYPAQARTGASGNYSTFSDDQAWSNPNSTLLASSPTKIHAEKMKQIGLASVPLSQKGQF